MRKKQKRNFLATLLFSQGVPLITAGDELGRTQLGNNNAYCQDNELSWVDWEGMDGELLAFTQQVLALRKRHPLFRRRTYPKPENTSWLTPDGREMKDEDWKLPFARCLGVLMVGQRLAERDERGNPVVDDDLLLLLNAHHEPIDFALPGEGWEPVLSTAEGFVRGAGYSLQGRSLALLVRPRSKAPSRKDV